MYHSPPKLARNNQCITSMPTLRLIYLDNASPGGCVAEDATNTPGNPIQQEEEEGSAGDEDDYIDTLLQEVINAVNDKFQEKSSEKPKGRPKVGCRKRGPITIRSFDERFNNLMAFRAKHGHCLVLYRASGYNNLGQWCSRARQSYKKIRMNEPPPLKITDEQIQPLTDVGFGWPHVFIR